MPGRQRLIGLAHAEICKKNPYPPCPIRSGQRMPSNHNETSVGSHPKPLLNRRVPNCPDTQKKFLVSDTIGVFHPEGNDKRQTNTMKNGEVKPSKWPRQAAQSVDSA
jgi:hypothetical protein